jgi:hypothetical protein
MELHWSLKSIMNQYRQQLATHNSGAKLIVINNNYKISGVSIISSCSDLTSGPKVVCDKPFKTV